MIRRLSFTILFLVALFALDMRSGSHHAAQPGSQPAEFVPDEIIVKFRDGVDEFTKDLSRFRVSGSRKKIFKIIPGLEVVKLRRGVSVEEAISLFEQIPDVLYAEPNYILHLTANPNITATPNDPSFGSLWGLAKISAPSAWNVKLLACKFFDANGSATTEGAIECLEYVKDMKDRGVNIVATNNSWGGNENSEALYDAIDV